MMNVQKLWIGLLAVGSALAAAFAPAFAQSTLSGQVLGAGAPVANATVTLWAASASAPAQRGQTRTDADGRFVLSAPDGDATLYLVAKGGQATVGKTTADNPAIALMSVLGSKPPSKITINEMTTVASVWTHAQFIDGATVQGHTLGLRIAAGNVPNFVDLATGGYGAVILDALNSGQTPTMATFATLSSVMAGCVAQVKADACASLFAAATGRDGKTPTDTLSAAQSIARNMAYTPGRVFALLDSFYPGSQGQKMRATPFVPYLGIAPSAWVLPLKFTGGGVAGSAKTMGCLPRLNCVELLVHFGGRVGRNGRSEHPPGGKCDQCDRCDPTLTFTAPVSRGRWPASAAAHLRSTIPS